MKTSELIGPALDWAVAMCEGFTDYDPLTEKMLTPRKEYGWVDLCDYRFSTDWYQGGPIIQHEEIEMHVIPAGRDPANWVGALDTDTWATNICVPDADYVRMFGPTPLIAAMRCFVASKLGDDINIPEGLCD